MLRTFSLSLPAIAQCHDIQTELNGVFSHDLREQREEKEVRPFDKLPLMMCTQSCIILKGRRNAD